MIYFDNASTTKTDEACLDIVKKYNFECYFNPSALYHEALETARTIKECREKTVNLLRGDGTVIFTSSGTESDNLALFGGKKQHNARIIVSESEHPAVMRTALMLKQRGYDLQIAKVDSCGRVIFEEFKRLVNPQTEFVSIMHVNNETGGINDIKTLCSFVKKVNPKAVFHSDGVQAVGKVEINLRDMGVDMYSFSSHKFHSPKGCGGLFVKKGLVISPIIFGGGQENGIRSATENVAGIVAMTYCLEKALRSRVDHEDNIGKINGFLREKLIGNRAVEISDRDCSPFVLCLAMKDVRGEVMLHALEKFGIIVGTGSACSSHKQEADWKQSFLPEYCRKGILRLSFGKYNTLDEAETFVKAFDLTYDELKKYARM